jgi:hypothetical protein
VLQAPLVHFFSWGQASVKKMNAAVKLARADGNRSYLGVTPLSELVLYKGFMIYEEFSNLLFDADGWLPALAEVIGADTAEVFLLVAV